jgi:hypothetical protein
MSVPRDRSIAASSEAITTLLWAHAHTRPAPLVSWRGPYCVLGTTVRVAALSLSRASRSCR